MSSLDTVPREESERRLAAILVADVVGYSRLMQADEEGTLARLEEIAATIIDPRVAAHRGHIFRTMGDGLLIEFPRVVEAVLCAAEVQEELRLRSESDPPEQGIQLRIGINIGDVIRKGNDVFGTGVNIAARLESLAEPGSIYISGEAYDQVRDRPLAFDDLGMKAVKNIARLVRVYRVRPGEITRASVRAARWFHNPGGSALPPPGHSSASQSSWPPLCCCSPPHLRKRQALTPSQFQLPRLRVAVTRCRHGRKSSRVIK